VVDENDGVGADAMDDATPDGKLGARLADAVFELVFEWRPALEAAGAAPDASARWMSRSARSLVDRRR
jgi:hypothetical protein